MEGEVWGKWRAGEEVWVMGDGRITCGVTKGM